MNIIVEKSRAVSALFCFKLEKLLLLSNLFFNVMNTMLDKVDLLVEELKSLLPMKEEYQKQLDKKFRLEFNYNSNHLEGNTLTYGETQLLLIFDDTKGNHTMREYEEMKAHDVAYKYIQELALDKEQPLTENIIKNLNEIILVRPFWKEAITSDGQNTRRLIKVGDYKEQPNSVRLQNGEIFEYPSPTDVPILIADLLEWYRNEENNLHPLTLAAMLHYKFVSIHPFDDGNGRVARLLMNNVLLKNNLPPVIIKSKDKENYLRALRVADSDSYEELITYVEEQLIWSLEKSITAAKGESIEDKDDLDKKLSMLKKEIEVEGNEKEIKEELFLGLVKIKYEQWIKELLEKIIITTLKFDEFYTHPAHSVSCNFDFLDGNSQLITNISDLDNFVQFLDSIEKPDLVISKANIFFNASFGAYKKGGTNPFECNYSVKIYFDRYSYKISVERFDKGFQNGKYEDVLISDRLLHIPMSKSEIDEADKLWGENLYNHLEYYRERIK